jgi:hypothetical protein
MALCALVAVLLALPVAGLAFDQASPPLDRTPEYRASTHVLEGQVTALQRLGNDGKPATAGPRFTLDLKVSMVHKSKKKGKPGKGDTVSVRGWVEGKQKQAELPKVKDEVISFLQQQKDGSYEALHPTGFKLKVASLGGRGPGEGKGKP